MQRLTAETSTNTPRYIGDSPSSTRVFDARGNRIDAGLPLLEASERLRLGQLDVEVEEVDLGHLLFLEQLVERARRHLAQLPGLTSSIVNSSFSRVGGTRTALAVECASESRSEHVPMSLPISGIDHRFRKMRGKVDFSFLNEGSSTLKVSIEPWGDAFQLPPSSLLLLKPLLITGEALVLRCELSPGEVVVWCDAGALDLHVFIDGVMVRK